MVRPRRQPLRTLLTLSAVVGALAAAPSGCGGSSHASGASLQSQRAALRRYLSAVEPLRLAVNRHAHTYILEDSYLSALTTGLGERDLDELPKTQAAQRTAIIEWRTGLTVLARRLGVVLPADLQAAGRGEIAPSPDGS